jgi:hypothetical protein
MQLMIQSLLLLSPLFTLGAAFCAVRYWLLCNRVEADWTKQLPENEVEATNDLLGRALCERTRMRYAFGTIAGYGLSALSAGFLHGQHLEQEAFHFILAATAVMWIVALRAVLHEGRSNERWLADRTRR